MSTHEGLNGTAEEAERVAKAKREALIERIRKLQRMTTERGATEGEALQAAALAQRLIAEHNIAASELSIRADAKSCIKDAFTVIRSSKPGWTQLCIAIEKLYGTICWLERKDEDLLGLGFEVETFSAVYYGFPVDVAGSIATLAFCSIAIDTEIGNLPKRTKKLERESFELGMVQRLRERIKEMRSRAYQEAKGSGALVVLKEQLVKEEFDKLGQKLYYQKIKDRKLDRASFVAGQRAGSGVALDSKISGQSQAQRRIS